MKRMEFCLSFSQEKLLTNFILMVRKKKKNSLFVLPLDCLHYFTNEVDEEMISHFLHENYWEIVRVNLLSLFWYLQNVDEQTVYIS